MNAPDRRLTPARPDLAAEHLRGDVVAEQYVAAEPGRIGMPVVNLHPRADAATAPDTQLLYGETVDIYEQGAGWAWVQARKDGYVGYIPIESLRTRTTSVSTHRVATLGANTYSVPSLKTPVSGQLPFGAEVTVDETKDGYARIEADIWVPEPQLVAIDHRAADWVTVAEMFLGAPYVWGGRSNLGLDCSALVQLARQAGGFSCLRDSDMQFAREGETLAPDAPFQRGDLVFWRGHVGILTDAETLLHANGHHMAVVREPLRTAIARIQQAEDSPVTRCARFTPA